MLQYNFSVVGGSLRMDVVITDGDYQPKSITFIQPSFRLATDKIRIYESGTYATALMFHHFGTIDGVAPTDLQDAEDKLLALVPSSSGSGSNYNTPTVYDTVADLPISFSANTIHSISVLSTSGTTTITVDGEETVLLEGQEYVNEASTLIDVVISIDSCTGTFTATTLN